MSLLDTASLLLTPNAYKEGKLYSVIPSDGSGDFTFTRATTATRVNSDGLVELVPYNLLTYSEQFDNAAWTKSSVTIISNNTTAPDGTLTADKLYPTSSGNFRHVRQSAFSPYTGLNTMSIYAKKAELSNITLLDYDGSGPGINFNLDTGVATDYATVPFISYSMTSVGDGWYRCTATALNGYFYWMVTDGGNSVAVTANGTDGIFIWGAQLVEGSNALPYQKTETRLNIPRIDYSLGGCPNILLEPQRTNLALQSSSFDSASWTKNDLSVTANSTISPSGVQDAEKVQLTLTTTSQKYIIQTPLISSGIYTISCFVKADTYGNIAIVSLIGGSIKTSYFNVTNGTLGTTTSGTTSTIEAYGNGWYRITQTATETTSANRIVGIYFANSTLNSISYAGSLTDSFFIWGAQLEAGSYATSYIPTTSASVTRNADVLNLNDLQNKNILSSDWTIYSEFIDYGNSSNNGVFILGLKNITQTDWIGLYRPSGGALTLSKKENNGSVSTTASLIQVTNGNIIKASIKCTSNNLKVYINGSLAYTSAFANPSLMTNFELARIGATFNTTLVKSALAFNVALTDDQLIELTTI